MSAGQETARRPVQNCQGVPGGGQDRAGQKGNRSDCIRLVFFFLID